MIIDSPSGLIACQDLHNESVVKNKNCRFKNTGKLQYLAGEFSYHFLDCRVLNPDLKMFIIPCILILFIPNILVTASRIIDRFGGRYRQDIPCRLSMAEDLRILESMGPMGMIRKAWVDSLARINCTVVYDFFDDTGLPDENGTYNGYLGRVQRGESDIFAMFFSA